ncbi:hypothetical protein ACTG9Q_14420 [Actinokineospora sp. 24-640]
MTAVVADGQVAQASLRDACAVLAGRVLDAVANADELDLPGYLDSYPDVTSGLGAVRLLGADVFAPHLLLNHPTDPRDLGIVTESFACFPPTTDLDTHEQRIAAWRDWATVLLVARLTGQDPHDPAVAPPPPETLTAILGDPARWQRWSLSAAQLSPLALPGINGPVVEAICREKRALCRGVVRAVLRRDHVTATRLARWVALSSVTDPVRLPLDPVLLVEHIRLHGGTAPRLLLDLAVARHLLGQAPA